MEASRYVYLKLLERSGKLSSLVVKPKFPLLVNGKHIADFYPDFSYVLDGKTVVEDVKGYINKSTPAWQVFRMKCAMLKAIYGFDVQVVGKAK